MKDLTHILLIDVANLGNPQSKALFFTAATRAIYSLNIFIDENDRKIFEKQQIKGHELYK